MAATSIEHAVDPTLNPQVAGLRVAKTMALTDLARSMREAGKDVIGLAAGESDFDTPAPIVEAGIEALRCVPLLLQAQRSSPSVLAPFPLTGGLGRDKQAAHLVYLTA